MPPLPPSRKFLYFDPIWWHLRLSTTELSAPKFNATPMTEGEDNGGLSKVTFVDYTY